MKLLDNWTCVMRRAWSVKLMGVAALLSGIEVALPFTFEVLPVAPGMFAIMSGGVTTLAIVARACAQGDL